MFRMKVNVISKEHIECELCHDTLVVTEIHGEGAGEFEVDNACPICDPDMTAYGDKESDWH
jgi:hypothetical protein